MRRLAAVLAAVLIAAGGATPALAGSAAAARAFDHTGCCWTIGDNGDNNQITDIGSGTYLELLNPGSNNTTPWDVIDCAMKYAQRGGWEKYCLYQDPNNTRLCMGIVSGFDYAAGCNSSANGERFWQDGGWIVNLAYSQGSYAGTNGVLQAVTITGVEEVEVFQVPGETTANGYNQWHYG